MKRIIVLIIATAVLAGCVNVGIMNKSSLKTTNPIPQKLHGWLEGMEKRDDAKNAKALLKHLRGLEVNKK